MRTVRSPRPSASGAMNSRAADAINTQANSRPKVRWGSTLSNLVPITAPPTAPIDSQTATIQSTLPWAA